MKLILKLVGGVLLFFVILSLVQLIASESGEVVVVTTLDSSGESHETRLWIVELNGAQYLRAGSPQAGWYQRMESNPTVNVVRGGMAFSAQVVPELDKRDQINNLMNIKYGWADDFIGLMFGREDAIAVRLEPA